MKKSEFRVKENKYLERYQNVDIYFDRDLCQRFKI